jgi:uncharacterized membrane protein
LIPIIAWALMRRSDEVRPPPDAILARMTAEAPARRPTALAILLIVGGFLGLIGAFALTLDKIAVLQDPNFVPNCNFSVLVQCGRNLSSPEGSVFGFPNPLLGLMGFPAPIAVGTGILAGARFSRWFWLLFNAGMLGALGFVIWLISVSIFRLGTLCPWCMLVWTVVIPMTFATTFFNVSAGNLAAKAQLRRIGAALYGWTPLLSLLAYVAVAVIAQVRLDVLSSI